MAGTFPGVSGTQQSDVNGLPMGGALLYVFNGGTTTLSQVYQDIGLAIPAPNPLTADKSGRIPLFFVADGTYRVRLLDSTGSTANGGFDYPQVPSIGASSSGGGGTSVDPTTILATGDIKCQLISGVISGFVRLNGRTVGSSTSGASERAAADTQSLFLYVWQNFADAVCPVLGGRGASAAADWASNKQITLPDMRGRAPFGLDDMGNAAALRLVGALFGQGSSTVAGSSGGESTHILAITELASHGHTVDDPGHNHALDQVRNNGNIGTGGASSDLYVQNAYPGQDVFTKGNATGISIENTGSDQPHNTMPPFALVTWYMKL